MTEGESAAVDLLDAATERARQTLESTSREAEKLIKEACDAALDSLTEARVVDKRYLNGSYQWQRADRPRADERIGRLEIDQAKRQEQIKGLIDDVAELKEELSAAKKLILEATRELNDYKTRNMWQIILIMAAVITAFIVNRFVQL